MNRSNFCNCILYLAEYQYEGSSPIYEDNHHEHMKTTKTLRGEWQTMFNYCPLCGRRIDSL